MKYDDLSDTQKDLYAKQIAEQLERAFRLDVAKTGLAQGTDESAVSNIFNELRSIGSADLVNRISNATRDEATGALGMRAGTRYFPDGLREAIKNEYSDSFFKDGGDETDMLRSIGYANDKVGRDSPDETFLRKKGLDPNKSHLGLIGKDIQIPNLVDRKGNKIKTQKLSESKGTLPETLPIKNLIKDTVESKKQPESAPAPESTPAPTSPATPETNLSAPMASKKDPPVSRMPIPTDSSTMLGEMLGEGRGFNTEPAKEINRGLPQGVLNTIYGGEVPYQKDGVNPFTEAKETKEPQVGPTRALAKTIKGTVADKTPSGGGASGGSGSDKAGLGYLRSREDMMARDKAAKEAMGKEALERRRTGEQRFATLRPEILAQQAERARLAEEKRQANEIKSGSGELLGRVIRDNSGKIIGTSTTKAGRRALGSGYKGATGTYDFSKPADSFAELDARDAVKGRMASRQQQVVDLMSGGPTEAQEKQIRPFDTGLAANTDNIGTPTPSEPSPLSPIPTNRGVAGGTFSAGRPFDNKNVLKINRENAAVRNDPDTTMQETATAFQQKLARSVDQGQRADNFLNQREVKKQQAIDAARLRDSVGATYQDSSAPVRQEPVDSKLPNATAEQIKKRLKQLQANQ